jgi:hypothetical protein
MLAFFISAFTARCAMPDTPKDKARKFIADEVQRHRPPPSLKEIRRRMGWGLLDAARKHHPR